jgi:acetylornithine deacetylase
VEILLNLLIRITRFLSLKRPELVYNIRDLFSHQAGFIVPDRCEARLDMHAPPSAPLGEITMELEERIAEFQREHAEIRVSFRFETIDAGYELPQKGSTADALREALAKLELPWEPQSFRSHSDANRLWAAGVKPILLGPGRLEQAHAPDESVSLEQVFRASRVYREIGISLPAE